MQLFLTLKKYLPNIIKYLITLILLGFLVLIFNQVFLNFDNINQIKKLKNFEDKIGISKLSSKYDLLSETVLEIDENIKNTKNEMRWKLDNILGYDLILNNQIKNGDLDNMRKVVNNYSVKSIETFERFINDITDKESFPETAKKYKAIWVKQLNELYLKYDKTENEITILEREIRNKKAIAKDEYNSYLKTYPIFNFLKHLLYILPLLILSFILLKFKTNKYWPIFLSIILLAIYAFFHVIFMYFPDYGQVVNYVFGGLITIGIGIYLINNKKMLQQN